MRFIFALLLLCPTIAFADTLALDDALRATYVACVGIDDDLSDLKVMAGINTAVTAVGTAAGIGATVTGFVKSNRDKQIEELEHLRQQLADMEDAHNGPTDAEKAAFLAAFNAGYASALNGVSDTALDALNKQSKKLGNWRTGLMATGTATNIAGAVIAGTNTVDADLKTQIKNCVSSVAVLRNSIMQARMNGQDVTEAQEIVSACGGYEYVDVSKINNRATGAAVSAGVGAVTGLTGTIVSAVANSDKTRNDNTDAGKQHEKNLNTAANVLAIGTTAASATATIFNATQISAIKKVASVAEKCTGVLK